MREAQPQLPLIRLAQVFLVLASGCGGLEGGFVRELQPTSRIRSLHKGGLVFEQDAHRWKMFRDNSPVWEAPALFHIDGAVISASLHCFGYGVTSNCVAVAILDARGQVLRHERIQRSSGFSHSSAYPNPIDVLHWPSQGVAGLRVGARPSAELGEEWWLFDVETGAELERYYPRRAFSPEMMTGSRDQFLIEQVLEHPSDAIVVVVWGRVLGYQETTGRFRDVITRSDTIVILSLQGELLWEYRIADDAVLDALAIADAPGDPWRLNLSFRREGERLYARYETHEFN